MLPVLYKEKLLFAVIKYPLLSTGERLLADRWRQFESKNQIALVCFCELY
jgi:hypothetical protein